jgi:hypothetical protein
MQKLSIKILIPVILLLLCGCKKVLDIEPTDKIKAEDLFADAEGRKSYLASLYFQLPTEDFSYQLQGFNYNGSDVYGSGGLLQAMVTDEAIHSEWGTGIDDNDQHYWDQGFKLIRDINILLENIPQMNISAEEKDQLLGEAAFLKGFAYYGLVKRYGGVPIILVKQIYDGNIEAVKVPRNTEKETWDFVMSQFDIAISKLPDNNGRRANKYMAYSLKARAALFAASLAKFGSRAPLTGDAVTKKLVGLEASLAKGYYKLAIEACQAVMSSGKYGLYKPTPANPQEAGENYRQMFEDPSRAPEEAIYVKGYTLTGETQGHNYETLYGPAQTANGWPHPGRLCPLLDLVDKYESYDNPGHDAPIVTTVDGDTKDYTGFDPTKNYLRFDNPTDIFKNKDARLAATVILPFSTWKNTRITIQAGVIAPNGEPHLLVNEDVKVNGKSYWTFGNESDTQHSGFDPYGGNNTQTGFGFKKFLNQNRAVLAEWNSSTTDFMEFRYAEILLTFAEAVFESGDGNMQAAKTALNATRRRAGHTVDIPLTTQNIMREREVEFAFENKRFWDLVRRREFHTMFNNTMIHAIMPIQDLRALPATKYIFVRVNGINQWYKTFQPRSYYKPIPGIGSNGLIQNPQF